MPVAAHSIDHQGVHVHDQGCCMCHCSTGYCALSYMAACHEEHGMRSMIEAAACQLLHTRLTIKECMCMIKAAACVTVQLAIAH